MEYKKEINKLLNECPIINYSSRVCKKSGYSEPELDDDIDTWIDISNSRRKRKENKNAKNITNK